MATRGILKPYNSYSFKDKDPIIDSFRTVMQDSRMSRKEVSEKSGVAISTIYNWTDGATRRPTFAAINAAGRACGKTLVWANLTKTKK